MSFISILAQMYFKFLAMEEMIMHRTTKDGKARKRGTVNLVFNLLSNCSPQYLYYPLRALAEYFNDEQDELKLSKKLTSESLL